MKRKINPANRGKRPVYSLLVALLVFFTGCGKTSEESPALNLYIWSDYITRDVLTQFTAKTGIKVNFDTYDSNEALLGKLQSGVAHYDVIVPSDYMVRVMISEKLVQKLDREKIINFKNLNPKFLNKKFDPDNQFSIPYLWGTTGIAYNKEKIKDNITSWSALFDPKYSGRILMLDDVRECFAIPLKMMGKSLNETDPEILKKAAGMLKEQKKLVKTYNSADFENILQSGDVDMAHGYNGQFARLILQHPDTFHYIIPKEGGTLWMDNFCIPSQSQNTTSAYAFLNFILEPEVAAEVVNRINYASANTAAREFIKPSILNDPIIYPPEDALEDCEFIEDVGPTATLLDQYWTEIKTQ